MGVREGREGWERGRDGSASVDKFGRRISLISCQSMQEDRQTDRLTDRQTDKWIDKKTGGHWKYAN